MVKPGNVQNILRDILIRPTATTFAASSGTVLAFVDPGSNHYWQIESVKFCMTTAYIASNAALVSLGIPGTTTKYLSSVSLGTAAIAQWALSAELVTTSAVVLAPNTPLLLSWTQNGSQSGVGQAIIRLRPFDTKWGSSKRPQRAGAVT